MMINEISNQGDLYGYTDNMKQITVKASEKTTQLKPGMLVPVRITKGVVFKLEGEILGENNKEI
jgi:TRAM domain